MVERSSCRYVTAPGEVDFASLLLTCRSSASKLPPSSCSSSLPRAPTQPSPKNLFDMTSRAGESRAMHIVIIKSSLTGIALLPLSKFIPGLPVTFPIDPTPP